MSATSSDLRLYRQPLWGTLDRVSRNCLLVAAAVGAAVVIAVFAAPQQPVRELTIQEMPERFARLILEQPEPKLPAPRTAQPAVKAPAPIVAPPPTVTQATPPPVTRKVRPVERRAEPKVAADKGKRGRKIARAEVAANLDQTSGSLDKVLAELNQALPASDGKTQSRSGARRSRGRKIRTGRASTHLAAVNNIQDLTEAEIEDSALATTGISIAAISDLESTGAAAAASAGNGATGGVAVGGSSEARSNQSLLAVVRRYAPGIQFCYENELKRNPGLRGKLVVSLTVAADGSVSNAALVEDTLHSPAVTDCVMAQMKGWRFPAIAAGVVTFKTPFVFTPPN